MISMVEVRTDQGVLLQLPLSDISSGYSVEEIRGLDPVKATLVSAPFAQLDGDQFHSSRRESRNIVFTIGYEPDYVNTDVRSLRKNLMKFFMPESRVNLRFIEDSGMAFDIAARVESFESPLWGEDPTATISVICYNPDFFDPTPIVINGSAVQDSTNIHIAYDGEVETGINLVVGIPAPVDELTIYNLSPDGNLRSLILNGTMPSNSTLRINTTPGAKSVTLTHDGITKSVLNSVSPYSSWIYLFPGQNQFRIYTEFIPVPYTLTYTTKYGGL